MLEVEVMSEVEVVLVLVLVVKGAWPLITGNCKLIKSAPSFMFY